MKRILLALAAVGVLLAACGPKSADIPRYDNTDAASTIVQSLSPWADGSPDRSHDQRTPGQEGSDRLLLLSGSSAMPSMSNTLSTTQPMRRSQYRGRLPAQSKRSVTTTPRRRLASGKRKRNAHARLRQKRLARTRPTAQPKPKQMRRAPQKSLSRRNESARTPRKRSDESRQMTRVWL